MFAGIFIPEWISHYFFLPLIMLQTFSIFDEINVIKLNIVGVEKWRYKGRILSINPNSIRLESNFDQKDMQVHGLFLGKGDLFLETYYTARWYNIYEIHAREDNKLRGWYCNISTPIDFFKDRISYVDLALDLIVFPDGSQVVADQDEFLELNISRAVRNKSLQALRDLQQKFKRGSITPS